MGAKSKSPAAGHADEAGGTPSANPAIAPQMEQILMAQDSMLEEAEEFAEAWFARRHDATRSALEAVRRMNETGADFSATMHVMAEWQQGAFKRMAADLQQWAALCASCAGRMGAAEAAAGRKGAEDAARQVAAAAETKHGTPV